MENRIYRKLGISDLDMVLKMETDFWSGFICEDNTRLFLSNPMNWIFACIENNRIIGFAYGYELQRLNNSGNMLYIHAVEVIPQYHRQGIASKIFENIKELCRLLGICKVFLFTQKSNIAACRLYEKSGGKITKDSDDDDRTYFFNPFD